MRSVGMLKDEAPPQCKLSMSLQEALLTATLIIFLVLHVLAGALLQRADAAKGPSPKQDLMLQPYD
jgi:hypothetical protein